MLNAAAPLELVLFTFPIKIILFSQSSHLASFDLHPGMQNNSFHFITVLWVETTGQTLCCFRVRHINEPARPPASAVGINMQPQGQYTSSRSQNAFYSG